MRYYNRILKILRQYEPQNPTLEFELQQKPWLEDLLFEPKPSRGR